MTLPKPASIRVQPSSLGTKVPSLAALALTSIFALTLAGCAQTTAVPESASNGSGSSKLPESAVAENMIRLHDYTNRIGYAVQAGNGPLASYYLKKSRESLAELEKVEKFEGLDVGNLSKAMLGGSYDSLDKSLKASNQAEAQGAYEGLTLACNACHSATVRPFIVIRPVSGEPPPGQSFAP